MDRSITNAVDEGGGCLTDNGRPTLKSLSGGAALKDNINYGRWTPKASSGGGIISQSLRRLSWFPILGWAFSALLFTFVVHIVFRGESCSPRAFIANVAGGGDDAASYSSPSPTLDHSRIMANDLAGVVDHHVHREEDKQEDLAEDLRGKQSGKDFETDPEQQHQELRSDDEVRDLSFCEHPSQLTMYHLFKCAVHNARENERETRALGEEAPVPRVAFLFLSRGEIALEPFWRRFLEGHEEFYSIYVHSHPQFSFKNDSFFYEHQVPSGFAKRFDITLVDSTRRLLAHAILDPIHGAANSWFVLVCESTIPIRSFNFTYSYLMESQHSFVDSFKPRDQPLLWFDFANEKPFPREQARKGEMWWAMKLHHALMVLEDWDIYYKYKRLCNWFCAPDEQYIPTLLGMKDPDGIENRTVYYVHWEDTHHASPRLHEASDLTVDWFRDIQSRRIDRDGQYHDTSLDAQLSKTRRASRSCYYNGVANSTCFLFARKVARGAREHLESLPIDVLEY